MSFADTVRAVAERTGLGLPPAQHPEPLAGLDYPTELALKREALAAFWPAQRLPGRPEPVVAALAPRGYRTTSKRRASLGPKGLALGFPGLPTPARGAAPSALDPPEHAAVYSLLADRLSRPPVRPLATALNWAVVRGQAPALAVILNVRVFDARVVRAAKLLAEALQAAPAGVLAAFLYLDPCGSDYYLEARRPAGTLSFKRLFGPEWLQVEADGVRLRFPPTVFSQVNGAMLGTMTAAVRELLAPLDGLSLLDLYCGYGLFAFTAGRDAAHVLGIDFDGPAIEAARGTAAHLGCADRVRFLAGRIDADFLVERVRPARGGEAVLLDPPRQGTAEGVAAAIADRRPERVVHICCGTDEIPREVAAWSAAGYVVRRAVPLDLFPGTPNLETLLLLTR
ncbi:MAG: methyltransferase domain-containing protein [Acidobacteria bacterium]|nr:methyltransferase domain-containing protein [Acidobacteriota bacterium]